MDRPDMTEAEWEQFRRLLHTHPQQYLRIAEDDIRRYPDDPEAYVDCHWAWIRLGRNEYALADIDTALSLRNSPATRLLRAILLRRMGRYQEAIDDFNICDASQEARVTGGFFAVDRAECHARLGNLEAALADCASLKDDHWTPGIFGGLPGDKSQVTEAIRRLAAEAKKP
jgi:tetratricopeptide (TPR) repeat protein